MCRHTCKKRRIDSNRFRAAGHAIVFLLKTMRAAHLAKNPGHRWPKSLEESFASHPMAVEWSPLLNKGMLPKDFFKSSNQKMWLTCRECGHDRRQAINHINAGNGCAYCGVNKKCDPCGCEWCLPRTLAAHPMVVEWHPTKNGDKLPAQLWKASGQKVWLICRECGHDRCQAIHRIDAGAGCGFCASKGDPCGCGWCMPRTFAAHPMAVEWHPTKNSDKLPTQLWKASGQKVWLTCRECGHDRCQQVCHINAGKGCGFCATQIAHRCSIH